MRNRQELRAAKRMRFRRVRAVLAAGVVLGVGSAATLAAWNDSEQATASFAASVFGIEGSTNGTDFTEHPAGDPAELQFSANFEALSPGSSVYALFSVRTFEESVAGSVQLEADADNAEGLGQWLTYSVRTISGLGCDASTFDDGNREGLPQDEPLSVGATASQLLGADGADAVNYCIEVKLPANTPNEAQGMEAEATWAFRASS